MTCFPYEKHLLYVSAGLFLSLLRRMIELRAFLLYRSIHKSISVISDAVPMLPPSYQPDKDVIKDTVLLVVVI